MLTLCLLALNLAFNLAFSRPASHTASPTVRQAQTLSAKTLSPLLKDADARIARYRQADLTVEVVGANGKPLRGVTVKLEQTRHAFLFGAAALSLLKHPDPTKEALYEQRFGDLFNFATVLAYWHDTDPEPNRKNLAPLTAQVDKLLEMGIRVKAHPLIIAGAAPRWAPADPDQTRDLTRDRIHDLVRHFQGKITVWDVVGDATTAGGAQTGLGAWARKVGPSAFTADALTWAREGSKDALLMYNDYKLDNDYTTLVQDLQKAKAPLDVLGLEAHMVGSEWPLEKVWATAETFAKFGRPLHFSEVTVLSDDQKADHSQSWPSTPEGEARQADYVEQLYTLLFSHPAVQSIGWWNFVDGDWDRSPAGFLRSDLSTKPVYARLHHLIKEKWWTKTSLKTAKTGEATVHAFAGHYRITAGTGKKAVTTETDLSMEGKGLVKLTMGK